MTHFRLRFSGVEHAAVAIDWSGMLKPALDIQETDKQYKITGSGVEEKDIQITLDNDVLMVRGERGNRRRRKVASTVEGAPTAAFSVP
jgi:HSP20 family protein